MASGKIIIVDDSEICREATAHKLRRLGYEVVLLSGPFGLGAAINQFRPNLVLVDVTMPALSGDQLVSIVGKDQKHPCPLVLYSDRPQDELARLVERSGAAGFIPKSADPGELVRLVDRYVSPAGG